MPLVVSDFVTEMANLQATRLRAINRGVLSTHRLQVTREDNSLICTVHREGIIKTFRFEVSNILGLMKIPAAVAPIYTQIRLKVQDFYIKENKHPGGLWELAHVFPHNRNRLQDLLYWLATMKLSVLIEKCEYDRLIEYSNSLRIMLWSEVPEAYCFPCSEEDQDFQLENLVLSLNRMMKINEVSLVTAEAEEDHIVFFITHRGAFQEFRLGLTSAVVED